MFKKISVFSLVLILLSVFICRLSFAFDDSDFQYWNVEAVSWKLADDWKLTLEEEMRWGDDASNPYYNHTDIGVSYSGLFDWLVLGINYRQANEEKSTGWKKDYRPHLNAAVKFDIGEFSFNNRGRLESRNIEDGDKYLRFRNKFTLRLPIKFTKFEIQPYLADEGFYDFNVEMLNKNRFYSGITFKLLDNLSGELYYLLERNKSSSTKKWTDVNALGTKLKLAF